MVHPGKHDDHSTRLVGYPDFDDVLVRDVGGLNRTAMASV